MRYSCTQQCVCAFGDGPAPAAPRAFQECPRAKAWRCEDGRKIKDALRRKRESGEQLDTWTSPQSTANSCPIRSQHRSKMVGNPSKIVQNSSPNRFRTVRAAKIASGDLLVRCFGRPKPASGRSWDGLGRSKTIPGAANELLKDAKGAKLAVSGARLAILTVPVRSSNALPARTCLRAALEASFRPMLGFSHEARS